MEQLPGIKTVTLDVRRRSLADLIFSGSDLQVEKNKPSLAVGVNYIGFSLAFAFMAGFTFMPIVYAIVMMVIGLAVVLRVPGRWPAVLAFALPCAVVLLYSNLFPRLPGTDLFYGYPGSSWIEFKRMSNYLTNWWGELLLITSTVYAFYQIFLDLKQLITGKTTANSS